MTNFYPSSTLYSSVLLESVESKGLEAWNYGQRLFSRDIKRLQLTQCSLSLFLTAEGKIQSVFWVIKQTDGLLLICELAQRQKLIATIEKYHFAEPFETREGPPIQCLWSSGDDPANLKGQSTMTGAFRNTRFHFEFCDEPLKASNDDSARWTKHRIQNLIPVYDQDWDDSTLVFDIGFEELCDPDKGCYIGQEIVERVRNRGGQGNRRLALLRWDRHPGETSGTILNKAGEPVGNTTISYCGEGPTFLSLGFVKRGAAVGPVLMQSFEGQSVTNQGQILRII